MGLDMYLYKEMYFSKFRKDLPKIKNFEDCDSITVRGTAIYWRKANAIHKWFVEKCADGVDECQDIYISPSRLEELLDEIKKVLKHKDNAEELLPTAEGFFFGGKDYDEYYFDELERTAKKIKDILTDSTIAKYEFYYKASW